MRGHWLVLGVALCGCGDSVAGSSVDSDAVSDVAPELPEPEPDTVPEPDTESEPDTEPEPDTTEPEPDTTEPDTEPVADTVEPDIEPEPDTIAPDTTEPQPDTACLPDCSDKPCGPDGCGGACGECTSWLATFGSHGAPTDVAIDVARRVVAVTFTYESELDFGGGALGCSTTDWVPALVGWEHTGALAFARCFPGWELNLDGFGNGHVGTAPDQYITLGGSMNGRVDWGLGPSEYAGGFDAFVTRYTPRGSAMWSHIFGDSSYQGVSALAVDGHGDTIVALTNLGTIEVERALYTSLGGSDIVLMKIARDGSIPWVKTFGDGGLEQVVTGLGLAANGDIVMAGAFSGSLDFGGGVMFAPGPDDHSHDDGFIVRLTGDGEHVWSRSFGSLSAPIHSATVGSDGRVVVSGYVHAEEPIVMDGVELAGQSAFILSISGAGVAEWGLSPVDGYILPYQMIIDPSGDLYVGADPGLQTRVDRWDPNGLFLDSLAVGSTFLTGLARDGDATIVIGTGPVGLDVPANPAGGNGYVLRFTNPLER